MQDPTVIIEIFSEIRFYKDHALKIRDCGEAGWSIHIFAPKTDRVEREIAILSMENRDLTAVLKKAEALVDVGLRPARVADGE